MKSKTSLVGSLPVLAAFSLSLTPSAFSTWQDFNPPNVPGIEPPPQFAANVSRIETLSEGRFGLVGRFSTIPAEFAGSVSASGEFLAIYGPDRSLQSIQPAASSLLSPSELLRADSFLLTRDFQQVEYDASGRSPVRTWNTGEINRVAPDGSTVWSRPFRSLPEDAGTFLSPLPQPSGALVGGNFSGTALFNQMVLDWDNSEALAATGFFGKIDNAGNWQWVRGLSSENSVRVRTLWQDSPDTVIVVGEYGSFIPRTRESPFHLQATLPDGSLRMGSPGQFGGFFLAEYDLSGNFLRMRDLEAPTGGSTAREYLNFEREPSGALLAFNRDEILRISSFDDVQVLASNVTLNALLAADIALSADWDPTLGDSYIQNIWPAANGDLVAFGKAANFRIGQTGGVTGAPYFFAHIDQAGNVVSAVLNRNFSTARATVDDAGNFYFAGVPRFWNEGAGLAGEFTQSSFALVDGAVVLERQNGPFSGAAEYDGWRYHPVLGFAFNGGSDWWYLADVQDWIYTQPNSSARSFWFYQATGGWMYTESSIFSWAYSVNNAGWVTLR